MPLWVCCNNSIRTPLLPLAAVVLRRCCERVISRKVVQLAMPVDLSEPQPEEIQRVQVGVDTNMQEWRERRKPLQKGQS